MRRRTEALVTVGVVSAAAFGLTTGAHALWSAGRSVVVPAVQTGAVSFAVQGQGDEAPRQVSSEGEAVSLVLPGAELVKVLDQVGPDPAPVFWRFSAAGAALGITGLSYDVAVGAQDAGDGVPHDLSTGIAQPGTVLEGSTVKVYRASVGGDCSTVPETPEPVEGEPAKDVYLYDTVAHVLQAPGSNPSASETEHVWCVSMMWDHQPDGRYVNDVQVVGTAEDGSQQGATARWRAVVAFAPSLAATGFYAGLGLVEALAEDGTVSRDQDGWDSLLFPDPSGEPDLVLTVDPAVTNLNPAVPAGDSSGLAPIS